MISKKLLRDASGKLFYNMQIYYISNNYKKQKNINIVVWHAEFNNEFQINNTAIF